jgi:hypothetical protein
VLRGIFGLKWKDIREDWRKFYNKELHDFNINEITRVNKRWKVGLVEQVTRMVR